MNKPTYTMDEVYEEAIRFCKEKGLPITCKKEKGLPKGEPGNQESCVIANLIGRNVGMSYDHYWGEGDVKWEYAIEGANNSLDGPILIDSKILQTFITEFDSGDYQELILHD